MQITIVAGARPNFMKIAPIIKAIWEEQTKGSNIFFRLVHTGQHYDKKMSGDFFEQLGIPEPDMNLEAGGGSQAEQTSAVMVGFERELKENRPDVVLVVGDVTSTMACTITAKKEGVDVVHVEAGIRSGDMSMPEEINRIVTDSLSDHFFTTSEVANANLRASGVSEHRIHLVGNTMIDTLLQNIDKINKPLIWDKANLTKSKFLLLTLHRPSNVDDPENLKKLLTVVIENAAGMPVVFPVHPRTSRILESISFEDERLVKTDPLGYHEFIFLVKHAKAVITDSGGITEEATVLGIPCMTLRNSTERPETVTIGSNELVGTDPNNIKKYLERLNNGNWKSSTIPDLWDGETSNRIVSKLLSLYY